MLCIDQAIPSDSLLPIPYDRIDICCHHSLAYATLPSSFPDDAFRHVLSSAKAILTCLVRKINHMLASVNCARMLRRRHPLRPSSTTACYYSPQTGDSPQQDRLLVSSCYSGAARRPTSMFTTIRRSSAGWFDFRRRSMSGSQCPVQELPAPQFVGTCQSSYSIENGTSHSKQSAMTQACSLDASGEYLSMRQDALVHTRLCMLQTRPDDKHLCFRRIRLITSYI
ncbi:hypothetical protein BD309DRAFT_288830 [Dichomitus squalens]|uniref:Uncharacterized protein n=1 Tax=Dichomitus squalens TaxID=114155 RepID=A0A4Q9PPQ4_9APHY|nr:hypothetical protein BD309DRAFT_288830 [Dichomitus squalens]TBU56329.1 hypothetical protein BD310DRAFT_630277 [Dichomitus squalens]